MSKFIETFDEDGDPIIINLEAIGHAIKTYPIVTVYFQHGSLVVLRGKNAENFWAFFSNKSLRVGFPPSEASQKNRGKASSRPLPLFDDV